MDDNFPQKTSSAGKVVFSVQINGSVFVQFMKYIKHKKGCFIRYPVTERWVEKTRRSQVFFHQIRSVGIFDATIFPEFDVPSQNINNS